MPKANRSHPQKVMVLGHLPRHTPAHAKACRPLRPLLHRGAKTTQNQIRELHAVAERHGWAIVAVFDDAGVSGSLAREDRPAMKALLHVVARREVDMVVAWSVDRLGRSLLDLLGFLGELHAKKVDLYLHQQGLDTSTPGGRAMFQMLGVFAEFERSMIRERVLAGLARARHSGTKS